ncbi:hypothetical protein JYU29_02005 [Tianweitania sp. BSSL-BM11]|uniref:Oligosaccharide flippase family protein n=1 Tax=Tianweitania aestuarii TaxID=2814886 RepID=A0ABS5RQY0_9HYPH|nr:hypothetical protein [Tianweitania aestuarii]MBS9719455.1 hypothetical protein [Tianweitania aestuarii]
MLSKIGRNLGVQILALAVTFLDRFVVVGLLLHQWGATLYSDWVVLLSAAGLLQLGELGLNIYYGNVWQRAASLGDPNGFARMLRVALGMAAMQALVLFGAALVFLAAADLPGHSTGLSENEARLIFLLLAAFSILAVVRGSLSQLYRGHGHYARGMIVTLIGTLALLFATALVAFAGGGPIALAGAYLVCQVLFGIGLMLWDLKRCFPELRFVPAWPLGREWRDAWRNARWLALEQCAPVLWLQTPILLLGLAGISGASLVGFVLVRTLVGFARQLATMLSIALGVELAGQMHTASETVMQPIAQAGRLLSVMAGVFGAAVWVFGAPLLARWTGDQAAYDPFVLAWLVLGSWVAAPAAPIAKLLAFTNRAKPNAAAWTVQLVSGLGLAAVFVQPFGAAGVAAGLAIGEILGMGMVLPWLAGRFLAVPSRYWLTCGMGLSASVLWCLIIGAAVIQLIGLADILQMLIALIIWSLLGALPPLLLAMPMQVRSRIWQASGLQKIFDQRQEA